MQAMRGWNIFEHLRPDDFAARQRPARYSISIESLKLQSLESLNWQCAFEHTSAGAPSILSLSCRAKYGLYLLCLADDNSAKDVNSAKDDDCCAEDVSGWGARECWDERIAKV